LAADASTAATASADFTAYVEWEQKSKISADNFAGEYGTLIVVRQSLFFSIIILFELSHFLME